MACATCGTENDAGSKFCMKCGSPVAAAPAVAPDAPSEASAPTSDAPASEAPAAGASSPPSFEAPAPTAPPSPFAPTPPATEAPPAAPSWSAPASDPTPPPPAWGAPPAEPTPPPSYAPPAAPTAPAAPPAWGAPAAAAPPAAPAWGAPQAQAAPAAPAWGAPQAPGGPPAAPAWGAPAAPGAPAYAPPAAPAPVVNTDPNGLGAAAGRLGNSPRKQAKTALAVAGAMLDEGEMVEALVAGKFEGNPAVLVLTTKSVLLADDRTWRPVTKRFELDSKLQVQGWQDDRTASLTLLSEGSQLVVDQIGDRPLAVEVAQRIRYRISN